MFNSSEMIETGANQVADVSGHAHVAIDICTQISNRSRCFNCDISQLEWLTIECFLPSCCRAPDKLCFGRIDLKPIRRCPVVKFAGDE